MAAGISALGWFAIAATAVTSAYSADQSRKAAHAQMDAAKAAQEEDARKAAEAETAAQVAANARRADTKRRRRSSALGMGDPANGATTDVLGGAVPAAAVGPTPAARAAAYYPGGASGASGVTALGAGSPATAIRRGGSPSGGGVTTYQPN